jgi:hypothetical protein
MLSKVDTPTPMLYPSFFKQTLNKKAIPSQVNLSFNNNDSIALYESKRLVKTKISDTQAKLEIALAENAKLR